MVDEKNEVHEALFSETTLKLGEIHWTLLKSESVMDSRRWQEPNYKTTSFGQEVGLDEIHWWVFEKEPDVDELLVRTERTLEGAQALKQSASKVKNHEPQSYGDLLLTLKDFAEQHRAEIDSLHEYVSWLAKRDVMAPRMLFTYRVWGSTRMSDRRISVEGQENAGSDINKLRELTEIVLGVRNGGMLVHDLARMEIGFSIFDSLEPQEQKGDGEIIIPQDRLIRRTSHGVYENCSTYFTEIRDSLRNIKIDIEKVKEQRALFESDEFWREFITKARNVKTSEPQLWDFKETLTVWHVKTDAEKRKAKVQFAQDVASFANTSGGVLILGVNDKREIVGVGSGHELENRLKVASDVLARHIEYDREIVSFRQVVAGEKICLIVLVSQACGVVAVTDGDGHYSYPLRRETGISRERREDVPVLRLDLKSDNRDFMHQLRQFIKDN